MLPIPWLENLRMNGDAFIVPATPSQRTQSLPITASQPEALRLASRILRPVPGSTVKRNLKTTLQRGISGSAHSNAVRNSGTGRIGSLKVS